MTDLNAEMAFLQSMQSTATDSYLPKPPTLDTEANNDDNDEEEEEDYDPSDLSYDNSAYQDSSTQNVQSSNVPRDVAVASNSVNGSSNIDTSAPNLQTENKPSITKQPRTIGGFVVDDDDDDDYDGGDDGDNDDENGVDDDGGGDEVDSGVNSDTLKAKAVMEELGDVGENGRTTSTSLSIPRRSASHTPQSAVTQGDASAQVVLRERTASLDESDGIANSNEVNVTTATIPETVASTESKPATNPQPPSIPLSRGASMQENVEHSIPIARLPHDRVGILEDRIAEDPKGDVDAWLNLINEHRRRNKVDDARAVYERFFKIFPSAAEQWVAFANMELQNDDFYRVEQIFNKTLLSIPNLQLWSIYLNYVRRRNNLTTDVSGTARQIVSQAYDFVLQNVGIDRDSGQIWQDFVNFIKSGPGTMGGSGWQDQQKMDSLRKAYQRAICVPTQAVNSLWKEYDQFEMSLNKMTGRKFLQEKSPAYMSARSSYIALQNITKDLNRTSMPRLPPLPGFHGDVEFLTQFGLWKRWIEWEKEDPLVLKDEDSAAYKARILYVYKQATMPLRFWPVMWFEAAEFCFQNDLVTDGNDFLNEGNNANPESCLLAFKRADRIEVMTASEKGEDGAKRRGEAVRAPYNRALDALYELISHVEKRQKQAIARVREYYAQQANNASLGEKKDKAENDDDDDDEDGENGENGNYKNIGDDDTGGKSNTMTKASQEAILNAQIEAIQQADAAQIKLLRRTISYTWIALMRAMRRVQGKGKVGDAIGGSRQIFTDARHRGRLTSDVYSASALIEYHCYKDPAATRIFEKGMKLFPEDEGFALEYLKHLIAIQDVTNARAVFETTVGKLTQKSENVYKSKPLYAFFHEYEAKYGELSQMMKLEKRISENFPDDPMLARFSRRYSGEDFDPIAARPLLSSTQVRPKAIPSIERPMQPTQNSPPSHAAALNVSNSPKRPLTDEVDGDSIYPRKIARGESPLKGAAGRRLVDAKRVHHKDTGNVNNKIVQQQPSQQFQSHNNLQQSHPPQQLSSSLQPPVQQFQQLPSRPVPELPREVMFLLSIIPRADMYKATVFNAQRMVDLLRGTELNRAAMTIAQSQPQGGYQVPAFSYPM